MKIIPASYELITEENILKKIELIARTCYKSEDKINDTSANKMCTMLLERNHLAMFEHANICLEVSQALYNKVHEHALAIQEDCQDYVALSRCYLKFSVRYDYTGETDNDGTDIVEPNRYIISGNIRAWLEFFKEIRYREISPSDTDLVDLEDMIMHMFSFNTALNNNDNILRVINDKDYETLTQQERMKHETFSVRFIVDRGVTHELVRMRECSFAQESTRYCNYSNNKFGKELTFIKPFFFSSEYLGTPGYSMPIQHWEWAEVCAKAEQSYMALMKHDVVPQEARTVLPNSIKSEIVVTANLMEWRHIFNLRACDSTGPAHPQMKEVMIPLLEEMKKKYPFAFGDLKPASIHA